MTELKNGVLKIKSEQNDITQIKGFITKYITTEGPSGAIKSTLKDWFSPQTNDQFAKCEELQKKEAIALYR